MARTKAKYLPSSSVQPKNIPNPIDVRVGLRIRLQRMLLGLSQEKLAVALGLTFQQVQKYEKGTNRVGASRLFHLSQVLQVPVSFFFEGLSESVMDNDEKICNRSISVSKTLAEEVGEIDRNIYRFIDSKESVELLSAYYKIKDETARQSILDFIKNISRKIEPV